MGAPQPHSLGICIHYNIKDKMMGAPQLHSLGDMHDYDIKDKNDGRSTATEPGGKCM